MGRLSELRLRRTELLEIAARHNARGLSIFGSVARNEDGAKSDVDFLVIDDSAMDLLDLGGLHEDLQSSLSCKVDVVTLGALKGRQREAIEREAIVL